MLIQTLHLLIPLLDQLLSAAATQIPSPYTPTDLILLDCGTSTNATSSEDGRNWMGDSHNFKYLTSYSATLSSSSEPTSQDFFVTVIPFMTARIIYSELTYTFPVSPGPKFIRLHFYPATYSGHKSSTFFFTVTANGYTLVRNFSPYRTVAMNSTFPHFIKEFIVTVEDKQLNVTFTPLPQSFAFINGVEIVSMPTDLYTAGNPLPLVNYDKKFFYSDNATSLETVYRLNVGGGCVANVEDTGLFRTWSDDSNYIFGEAFGLVHRWSNLSIDYTKSTPSYVAPETIYITQRSMGKSHQSNLHYNLTWSFLVDTGFHYLLRLHFCETERVIVNENDRVFYIYINNMTAEEEVDVFHWSGGRDIPVYKDYVVWVPEENHNKQDLRLALHPSMQSKPRYADAILNGLEIFKLNKSDGSLAGYNPELVVVSASEDQQQSSLPTRANGRKSSLLAAIVGALTGTVFILSVVVYVITNKWKRHTRKSFCFLAFSSTSTSVVPSLPTDICHRFAIVEIKQATANFNDRNLIGHGGFGKVYRGYIVNGCIPAAIKRLDSSSKQGSQEFKTEIEMLSQLRHVNLVSLIGYCVDEAEMILVYDYMSNGTLREHLYETNNDPLPWKKRLEICIGTARGLQYLHNGLSHTIIHRDVKTTNILLDEKLVAKVSDFGLSKMGLNNSAVSTVVKGTWGYLDPEYARFQQLTEKSDVYSFGVVLLEVLCARKPVIQNSEYDEKNIVNWARKCIQDGTIYHVIDPYLKAKIAPECFNKFVEIAESCVRNQGIKRPTMHDVMGELEFALELQEAADAEREGMNPGSEYVYPELSYHAPTYTNLSRCQSCLTSGGCTISATNNSTGTCLSHWRPRLEEDHPLPD